MTNSLHFDKILVFLTAISTTINASQLTHTQ